VMFKLSGDKELRFSDARKFGWVKLVTSEEWRVMSREFGPEPGKDLDLEAFRKVLGSTNRAVKIAIMDQKKISGVGNIYACDALFLAKIDPRRPANKLDAKDAKRLYEAILKVLKAGIKYRGASDQYYLDALGQKGHYQEHFLVYGRTRKDCFDCKGKVKRIVVGGRGTFWCSSCQK
jgi:formamidopyrimidine-DNA glycosylase